MYEKNDYYIKIYLTNQSEIRGVFTSYGGAKHREQVNEERFSSCSGGNKRISPRTERQRL